MRRTMKKFLFPLDKEGNFDYNNIVTEFLGEIMPF